MGGLPKGLETVGNARVIDRVVSVLRHLCDDIVLSANAEEALEWLDDVDIVRDASLGLGGVSGIHAALGLGRDILVVAWDMPFVSSELLGHLLDVAGRNPQAWAVVPESDSQHGTEPFCAWYSARCRRATEEFLAGGGGPARELLAAVPHVVRIPVTDVERFGDPRTLFLSVNTREDLAHARAIAEAAR